MYPSDVTDREWALIAHFFDRPDPRGNRGRHTKRTIVNAILYVVRGGIQWRMLPRDFPPWGTVYDHWRRWNQRGIWDTVLQQINRHSRLQQGRDWGPTYGIIDSQSVKTQYASAERGFDGGKKNQRPQTPHRRGHLRASAARGRPRRQSP